MDENILHIQPSRATVVYESQLQSAEPEQTEPEAPTSEPVVEQQVEVVAATPEPEPSVSDTSEEEVDTKKVEFAKQLEEAFGITPDQLQEMKQFVETAKAAQAAEQLRNEWGVDKTEFDNRMNLVLEKFEKLSPEQQKALDNNEGIKILWAAVQAEQPRQTQTQVPTFDRSGVSAPSQSPFKFTASELRRMSQDEYASRADEILLAYANKQVNLNA